ncbi:unnamed protein product [Closterium sp. Naga37s-1]|nr:unnamed protein product [Closterium sp. Naga37s-1]
MDGTLLNSASKIAPSTAEALRAAHARGVRVAIATGKARPAAMSALGAAGLVGAAGIFSDKSPGVFLQGLRVYGKGGRVVHNALLPNEVTQEGFEFALKHGKALIGFCGDRCVTLVDHPLVEALHTIYYEPRAEVMPSLHHIINETPIQKLLFYDTPHGIDGFIRPFWSAATAGRATVTQAVPDMLEILPPGQSKGAGVRVLLDHLKLSAEQVMAIGDGENDLEMIEMVGWGVAMANGSEKTKAVAKATVASNDDDDLVEVHLVKEISSRSDSFFEALEKLEDLNRGIVETCDRIRLLRGTVGMLDEDLLEGSRKLQTTKVRRENLLQLHQKLKLVAFVHQAMATLKLLVSSGDCAGALDVMDDLRRLMEGQELAGLHCFRPLNDLLLSSSDAVNSLLTADFVREAVHDAADVAPSAIVTSFNLQKSVPPAATLLSIVNLEREGTEEREARLREHLLPLVISLLRTSRLPAVLRAYRDAVNVDIKAAVKTVVGELLPLLFLQHAAAAAGGVGGGAGGEGGEAAADALNAPSLALKLRALAPPAFVHLLLAVFSAVQTRLVRAAAVRNVVSGIATAGAAAGATAAAAEPAVGYEAAAVAAAFASGAELVVAAEAAESKLLGRKGVGKGLGGGGAAGGVGGAAGSGEAAGGDVSSVTALATFKQLRADVLRENAEAVSDACEVAHGRWAKLLGVRAQVHPKLSLGDFVDMYAVTSDFIASTERLLLCGAWASGAPKAASRGLGGHVCCDSTERVRCCCVEHGMGIKPPKLTLGDLVDVYASTSDFIASTEGHPGAPPLERFPSHTSPHLPCLGATAGLPAGLQQTGSEAPLVLFPAHAFVRCLSLPFTTSPSPRCHRWAAGWAIAYGISTLRAAFCLILPSLALPLCPGGRQAGLQHTGRATVAGQGVC